MASQNTILDVQNVSKRFGARELFANLSFSIAEGQKVGLIARNGYWQVYAAVNPYWQREPG